MPNAFLTSAFACALASLTVSAAHADVMRTRVTMTAEAEVPPSDSLANGYGDVTFDTQSRKLTWTVVYANLSGPSIGAHFHGVAEPGKVAGIVVPLGVSITSPVSGSTIVPVTQVQALIAGKWYLNVHTDRNPGGELRGQVVFK